MKLLVAHGLYRLKEIETHGATVHMQSFDAGQTWHLLSTKPISAGQHIMETPCVKSTQHKLVRLGRKKWSPKAITRASEDRSPRKRTLAKERSPIKRTGLALTGKYDSRYPEPVLERADKPEKPTIQASNDLCLNHVYSDLRGGK